MQQIGTINDNPKFKLHDVVQLVPAEALIIGVNRKGDRFGGQHITYTLMLPDGNKVDDIQEHSIAKLLPEQTEEQRQAREEAKRQHEEAQAAANAAAAAAAASVQGLTPPPSLSVVENSGERRISTDAGYAGPYRRSSDAGSFAVDAGAEEAVPSAMAGDDQNGQ